MVLPVKRLPIPCVTSVGPAALAHLARSRSSACDRASPMTPRHTPRCVARIMSGCGDLDAGAAQRAPKGGVYRPRRPRASPRADRHMAELRSEGRLQRLLEERVIERFLKCGDPRHGFARVYCPECRYDYLLSFSCKARYFCPSCHQKRVLAYGDWRIWLTTQRQAWSSTARACTGD